MNKTSALELLPKIAEKFLWGDYKILELNGYKENEFFEARMYWQKEHKEFYFKYDDMYYDLAETVHLMASLENLEYETLK